MYWLLERSAQDQWQIRLLIDASVGDGTPPEDISPAQLQELIPGNISLSYNVSLSAGGAVAGSLSSGQNIAIMFNQLGDMIRVKTGVVLASENSFPDTAQTVNSSLQFTDSRGDFCLSLTGYNYATTCR